MTKPIDPANSEVCDHCGTRFPDRDRPCPVCGAPVCCPKCCLETLDGLIEDGHPVPVLLRPLAVERLEEVCGAPD